MTRTRSAPRTRAAILDAARARFATDGYERTTMRAVAADVGVDAAMVVRYFGNKQGLFAEAAEFELALPDLSGIAPEDVALVLMPRFFAVWEGDSTFVALLRASATSETAAQTMRNIFATQVAPAVAQLTTDHPKERAVMFGSVILGLALVRYVLGTGPMVAMDQEEVTGWAGPLIECALTGPAPTSASR